MAKPDLNQKNSSTVPEAPIFLPWTGEKLLVSYKKVHNSALL